MLDFIKWWEDENKIFAPLEVKRRAAIMKELPMSNTREPYVMLNLLEMSEPIDIISDALIEMGNAYNGHAAADEIIQALIDAGYVITIEKEAKAP